MPSAYDYEKKKWVEGEEAQKIIDSENARHAERFKNMPKEERLKSLYEGADIHARRHGLPKEQVRAEYLDDAKKQFPGMFDEVAKKELENKRISLGLDPKSNGLEGAPGSSLRKSQDEMYAKKLAKEAASNSEKKAAKGSSIAAFDMLERDLPKGGSKVMKVAAEEAPSAAERALVQGMKRKAIGKTLGKAALGGAAGLMGGAILEGLDAETSEAPEANNKMEEMVAAKVNPAKLQKTLPQEMKGNPMMIDKKSPTLMVPRGKSDAEIEDGFHKELAKHTGGYEHSANVTEQDEEGNVLDKYRLKMKSNKKPNADRTAIAAGLHSVARENQKVNKPAKGKIRWEE